MKTIFPFALNIDEQEFSLIYTELKKEDSKKLLAEFTKEKKKIDSFSLKKEELINLEEKRSIKREIAAELVGAEKVKELKEIYTLTEQIEALHKEIAEKQNETFSFEDIAKKKFLATIQGADLEKLKEVVSNKGIAYNLLMDSIDEAIEEQKKKK